MFWIRLCLSAIGLLICSNTIICSADEVKDRRINVSPIFFQKVEEKGSVEETDTLGPFYSHYSSPKEEGWAVRPFLSYHRDRQLNIEEWQFLYPLGKYRLSPGEKRSHFLPLMSSVENLHPSPEEGLAKKFDFFPVFWGTTKDGEAYGGVFPVYGKFKNRFVRDEITFALWPLYSNSKWDGNEKTTLLWPILSWTKGPTEQAFRIWPLYGHEKRPGEYESHFYLWPFFFYGREDLDTDAPLTKKMFFPFYISETSVNQNKKIILWPLFNYYHNKQSGYKQWDLPWPFIEYARAEDYEVKKFWPLFKEKRRPNVYEFTLLWPAYQYSLEDLEEDKAIRTTYRFLLISKAQNTVWRETNEKEIVSRLWPIYYLKTRRDGSEFLHFPEIIPIDDEGYERNYGPIFRIYEYQKDKEGAKKSKFLWGLYRHEERADRSIVELSFLLSWRSEPASTRLTLLQGLFEYLRTTAHKSIKVFYIPKVLTWGVRK